MAEWFATFDEFVAARGAGLVRSARMILLDPHLAEDATQEVLGKVYDHWRRVRGADRPDAYVQRMLVNECMNFLNRSQRREVTTEPELLPERSDCDHAESVALRHDLYGLLRSLPVQQRTALAYRYGSDMPFDDIAEIMGLTAETVRSHCSKGLATLRARRAPQGISHERPPAQ